MFIKRVFLVCFCCLAIIVLTLLFKQYFYFKKAKRFFDSKNYIKAVDCYTMIIYMHVPFSIFEKKAINDLLKIAKLFEKEQKVRYELYVYERLRSAIYGIRWLKTPYKDILKQIEPKIAFIRAKLLIEDGYKKGFKDTYRELINVMQTDLAPNPIISFIAILCFFTFLIYTTLIIFKVFSETTVDFRKLIKHISIIFIILTFWMIALYLA